MLFVGHDWAEGHHDIALVNETGRRVLSVRVPDGAEGVGRLHALVREHAGDGEVVVGTETERGLFVAAMVAAGYAVYAINPKAVDRYRDRHRQAGGKSAALVAFGDELWHSDAIAVLSVASTPASAAALRCDRIARALRRGGRQRYVEPRAHQIHEAFTTDNVAAPADLTAAFGHVTAALVGVIAGLNREIGQLETVIAPRLGSHTDGHIVTSMPGLGETLPARVLGEFGDDPGRYADSKARKNHAGTSPITRQSGKLTLVAGRRARNQRLADACYRWAFCSLDASPGARSYYDAQRARGKNHNAALWALANRWVGILHGCLRHRQSYDEPTAWAHHLTSAKTGAA